MALGVSLTPVSAVADPGGSGDTVMQFDDSIPAGTFVVFSVIRYAYLTGGPAGVFSLLPDSVDNEYAPLNAYPASIPSYPYVMIFGATTQFDIVGGSTYVKFAVMGDFAPLAKAWILSGSHYFVNGGSSSSGEGSYSNAVTSTTWDASGSMPTIIGEHILIATMVCGHTGGHVANASSGNIGSDGSGLIFRPADLIGPPAHVAETWEMLYGSQTVNPGGSTAYDFAGAFTGIPADSWGAAQVAFRPAWHGSGRLHSITRGIEGRYVTSIAGDDTDVGSTSIDTDGSGGAGITPTPSKNGRSTNVLFDRGNRLIHVGTSQENGNYGGYYTTINVSKDQGNTWIGEQILHNPGSPISDDIGYVAVEACLDKKTGLLLLMLFDGEDRSWWSSVGTLDTDNITWNFSTPIQRVTGAGFASHLIYMQNGRFRFAYCDEGNLVTIQREGALLVDPLRNYFRVTDGDAIRFIECHSLSSDGGGTWTSPELVLAAEVPTGPFPPVGSPSVYYMIQSINQLSDSNRGLYGVAYNILGIQFTPGTIPTYSHSTYMVAGELQRGTLLWIWDTPVLMRITRTDRGSAFIRRPDNAWIWFGDDAGASFTKICKTLQRDGSGVWV